MHCHRGVRWGYILREIWGVLRWVRQLCVGCSALSHANGQEDVLLVTHNSR